MPRVSKEKKKQDEEKILKLLLTNAHESIDSIAKKCNLSRQTAWRIIKRLEENQTIWGYTAAINDDRLGKKTFAVLMKKNNKPIDPKDMEKAAGGEFSKELKKYGIDIVHSMYMHGSYDFLIIFTAEDLYQAKHVVSQMQQIFEGYLADIQLLEELFPFTKNRILNPNHEKFREFSIQ